MGALIMFGLMSVIAIVGVIYFNDQDKKGNGYGSNSSFNFRFSCSRCWLYLL